LCGIDSKVSLNKGLWGLAEHLANPEASAPDPPASAALAARLLRSGRRSPGMVFSPGTVVRSRGSEVLAKVSGFRKLCYEATLMPLMRRSGSKRLRQIAHCLQELLSVFFRLRLFLGTGDDVL